MDVPRRSTASGLSDWLIISRYSSILGREKGGREGERGGRGKREEVRGREGEGGKRKGDILVVVLTYR